MPTKNTAVPIALVVLAAVLVLGGLALVLMPDDEVVERVDNAPSLAEDDAAPRRGRVPAGESAPAAEPAEERASGPASPAPSASDPEAATPEPDAAAPAPSPRPVATRAPVETPADRVARLEAELTRLTTAERKTRFHPKVRGVLKRLNEARAELGLGPVE